MLVFPNCKINLGLYVTEKRPDGYHNLQTVFYPINWCDALEVLPATSATSDFSLECSGLPVTGALEENILFKAYTLVKQKRTLPPVQVYLQKHIPMGAGLGGGSSDGAFFLTVLNTLFDLGFDEQELLELALSLGSDCPFFIKNRPVFAEGRGESFTEITLDLSAYYILCVYPGIHSSTAGAFKTIVPAYPKHHLAESLLLPVDQWNSRVANDFEPALFSRHPELAGIKSKLYQKGALYASLSGSGSALYGIFKQAPDLSGFENYSYHLQQSAPYRL